MGVGVGICSGLLGARGPPGTAGAACSTITLGIGTSTLGIGAVILGGNCCDCCMFVTFL